MKVLSKIPKESGVYVIYNNINSKFYIGSSNNLYKRYCSHKLGIKASGIKSIRILYNAYKKYSIDNFTFEPLMITNDYVIWEEILIRLLNPDYNIMTAVNGKQRPNLGKKFNKNWSSKLPKCRQHSLETKKLLSHLNKKNSCKLKFYSKHSNEMLYFNSWVEACRYFNVTGINRRKVENNTYKWRNYIIYKQSMQNKKVLLQLSIDNFMKFNSSLECDRYLNLWRGATSNAVNNNQGILHNYKVSYI